jgi:N,N'-diacetyllegionaminate synthase
VPGTIEIAGRQVGPGSPCFVICEVGQAHDGSLGAAHAYIDIAATAGVDAVKFQTHIAAAESTLSEPFRVKFSKQDETRFDYWARMEFSAVQWRGLADHAAERGLVFLSSPFSFEALDLLNDIEVPAWKVASGELFNPPLVHRMAATGKPVLLSSGMASWHDLDETVKLVIDAGAPVAIFQCTTAYPCPPDRVGLNVLALIRDRYGCPVGLSDHSGTVYAGMAAVALGANLLEVHIAFSPECFGPDVPASVTPGQLADLVRGIRFIEECLRHPLEKDDMAGELEDLRLLFGKSVVAKRALPAGHELALEDLALKKPGTGIPAARFDELRGRRLRRAVVADDLLVDEDLM